VFVKRKKYEQAEPATAMLAVLIREVRLLLLMCSLSSRLSHATAMLAVLIREVRLLLLMCSLSSRLSHATAMLAVLIREVRLLLLMCSLSSRLSHATAVLAVLCHLSSIYIYYKLLHTQLNRRDQQGLEHRAPPNCCGVFSLV
jgi:hypothetical protein